MASSPHSLSFPSDQNPKRHSHSQSGQLPLPTSLNAAMSQRPQGGVLISYSGPSSPRILPSHSPTTASFPSSTLYSIPQPQTSSTHAGGIQPSSSFFHPSRPAQQPQYSRPPSATSFANDSHPMEIEINPDVDGYPLAPLTTSKRHSLGHSSIADTSGESGAEDRDRSHFSTLKLIKKGREPLLPIGGSVPRRPSVSNPNPVISPTRPRNGPILPSQLSPGKTAAGRAVRSSFERVLTFSRGMSFDSIRRKSGSPGPGGGGGIKDKIIDEEHGHAPRTPESPFRPLRPESPVHFGNDNTTDALRPPSRSPSLRHPSSTSPSVSPTPSFIPTPPPFPSGIPPAETPVRAPSGRVVKRYELHPSRNRFFFGGRVLTGGDSPWAFLVCFGYALGLAGIWLGTTCVFWWTGRTSGGVDGRAVGKGGKAVVIIGAYLAALVISSMVYTAATDPGILPRNLDLDPPYPATSPSDGGTRAPMPRDLKVRSDVVRVKYCPTCKTYRPPRSSHCKICDNCVDGCDHHCQWVNNCIGRRNYTTFFILLLTATMMTILIIITSALHLYLLTVHDNINFRGALSEGVGSAVAFCLGIAVVWPVGALLSYHMRLLFLNVTTIEQIRNQAHKTLVPGAAPPNPFSHGNWRRNLVAVLCRPVGRSWLDASAVATEDKREVNPGLVDVGEGK